MSEACSYFRCSLLDFRRSTPGLSPYPRFSARNVKLPENSYALRFMLRTSNGVERELKNPFKVFGHTEVFRVVRATRRHKSRRQHAEVRRHLALLTQMVRAEAGPFAPGDQLLIYHYEFAIDPKLRRIERPDLELLAKTTL